MIDKAARVPTKAEIVAEEDLVIDFQFLVQDLAEGNQLTRTELADKIGITKARLSQLLGSGANPTLHNVARILHALGEEASISVKRKDRKVLSEKVLLADAPANTNSYKYEEPSHRVKLKSTTKGDLAYMAIGAEFARAWTQDEAQVASNDCRQSEDETLSVVAA